MKTLNQKGFGVFEGLLIFVSIALIGGVGFYVWQQRGETQPNISSQNVAEPTNGKPKLVSKTYCSDVCPANTQTYTVYDGITNQEQCDKIDGKAIKDAAWGAYIGCGPK